MRRIYRCVCGLAAVLVLGLVGLSTFFFIAGRDIDPPDVSDALPPSPVPPIAEAENMVPVLMAATNRLSLTKDDKYFINCCHRKDGWDRRLQNIGDGSRVLTAEEATAWADRILATNAALFAMFDKAVRRPRAQYPADLASVCNSVWHGSADPRFWQIWQFESDSYLYGALVSLRARRQCECGQAEAAAKMLLEFGEMFARFSYQLENGSLFVHLRSPVLPVADELVQTAIACELPQETVLAIDAALARWAKDYRTSFRCMHRRCVLRAKNVMPSWRGMKENPAIPNSFFEWPRSLDAPERFRTLINGVGKVIEVFPGYQRYLFQPNRTIGELADIIRETESYSIPYTAETRVRCHAFEVAHPLEVRWTRRNGCGTAAVNGYSSWAAFRHLGVSAFVTEASRVSIAAARYKRKHGCYPQTLDALVPEFLAEVPRDPFDASKPLGYNAEQCTLHTVGPDGSFNGKVRDPRLQHGGLRLAQSRYIRRIDGRTMEIPLKIDILGLPL